MPNAVSSDYLKLLNLSPVLELLEAKAHIYSLCVSTRIPVLGKVELDEIPLY